jgi:hypothetical protein
MIMLEDPRVIDNVMPHPNQEDVVEKEYVVDVWVPVLVEVEVYASDEEEAGKEAIRLCKEGRAPYKFVDKDFSEASIENVEVQ